MPSEELSSRRITQVLHEGFADPSAGPSRRLAQSDLVDDWSRTLWERAGEAVPGDGGAALAAIGSLGRRSLGPASDLDLVSLVDPARVGPEQAAALAGALWYPIWDSGTSLDHSVRAPRSARRSPAPTSARPSRRWTCGASPGTSDSPSTPPPGSVPGGGERRAGGSGRSWTSPRTVIDATAPSPTPPSRTSSPTAAGRATSP
ncbi:hypothetical protein [Brachybacterium sp. GPGPB12]|uniref:hypothetical protein n=1 Tax=Brachybacterium sp. GPGPB12 TaxID=3023517 RepID=UPI0031345959